MSTDKKPKFILEVPEIKVEDIPCEPHFLTEHALCLRNVRNRHEGRRDVVPPQTPNSEYGFQDVFKPLPSRFPDLSNLKIPYVRVKGVKHCIEELSKFFGCTDYRVNLLQFWFLDIITDCIWRTQDDFKFPIDLQKTVLAWVLHFINILRDPTKNMSRKEFFTVFKEAILIAAEIIDEGCDEIPTPEKVFSLIEQESETESSFGSSSTLSSIEIKADEYDNISYVELPKNGKRRLYELPKKVCTLDESVSSVDTPTETETVPQKAPDSYQSSKTEAVKVKKQAVEIPVEGEKEEEELEDIEFYQPDLKIPVRFLPLPEEMKDESIEEEEENSETIIPDDRKICRFDGPLDQYSENLINQVKSEEHYDIQEASDKYEINYASAPSSTETKPSTESNTTEQEQPLEEVRSAPETSVTVLDDKQILKGLADQKMWEQRFADMEDPRKGWVPTDEVMETNLVDEVKEPADGGDISEDDDDQQIDDDNDEWVDIILEKQKRQINTVEDKQVINFGVLWAITDFIFKYFYESFQFTLIKLAFQAMPDLITQKVNEEWQIPKKMKSELVKPKPEKQKKVKVKKEKVKKEKAKKAKPAKKDKKPKPGKPKKPPPLTKEEKAELERQRKERERLEQERRLQEEHKRYMFPLTDAATDDFYKGIFENWVKVDFTKGKKKRKK